MKKTAIFTNAHPIETTKLTYIADFQMLSKIIRFLHLKCAATDIPRTESYAYVKYAWDGKPMKAVPQHVLDMILFLGADD